MLHVSRGLRIRRRIPFSFTHTLVNTCAVLQNVNGKPQDLSFHSRCFYFLFYILFVSFLLVCWCMMYLRAFSVCAPRLWNSLPLEIKKCDSFDTFESKLKTHLFKSSYSS